MNEFSRKGAFIGLGAAKRDGGISFKKSNSNMKISHVLNRTCPFLFINTHFLLLPSNKQFKHYKDKQFSYKGVFSSKCVFAHPRNKSACSI